MLLKFRLAFNNAPHLRPYMAPDTFVDACLERGSLVSQWRVEFTLPKLLVEGTFPLAFNLRGFDSDRVRELKSKITVSRDLSPGRFCQIGF